MSDTQRQSSLFTAGLFKVSDIHISGNTFCNKNIFTTIALLDHVHQKFDFYKIEIFNNTFQTRTTYILFNALYSMISSADHELNMTDVKLKNNTLYQQQNSRDLNTSSFIQTNRISNLTFNSIYLENHQDISFGLLEFTSNIKLNSFYCINDENYKVQTRDPTTSSCIQMNESILVNMQKIRVDRKKVQNNPLIVIENHILQQATLNIIDGEFQNLVLKQSQKNSFVSPIYVRSSYQITLNMENCHFKNNNLDKVVYSLTYSTTGVQVENFGGQVKIKNSSFRNCYSNSKYNFIYVQSDLLDLDNIILNKSSFLYSNESDSNNKGLFIQEGGMLNLKVNTLSIANSNFRYSTGSKGSFLFIQSSDLTLQINIYNSTFSEGYSSISGGAFFIDRVGGQLLFNCNLCFFQNIYTLFSLSSAIDFEKYFLKQSAQKNKISFIGGSIKNIQGVLDSFLINVSFTNITFNNISLIMEEELTSDSFALKNYLQKYENLQQSSFLNLIDSDIQINLCTFSQQSNKKSTQSLLINSLNSLIYFKESNVSNSFFQNSVFLVKDSKVTIEKSQFINININIKDNTINRILKEKLQIPNDNAPSLMILYNSELKVTQQSIFKDIICLNNCNGGVFQINNGNINIEQVNIMNTQSKFGGALYINGIQKNNIIKDAIFQNCKSDYDGGALYFKSQKNNVKYFKFIFNILFYLCLQVFTLNIERCQFINNNADNNGGGLYINSEIKIFDNQTINIKNSTFTKNNAKIGGAIYQQNISSSINENDTIFKNNNGSYFGDDVFSYPTNLNFVNLQNIQNEYKISNESNLFIFKSFRSGDTINNLQFQLRDKKNRTINPELSPDLSESSIYLQINPSTVNLSKYGIRGYQKASQNKSNGVFSFNNITLIGTPNSSVFLEVKSDQIQILNKTDNTLQQNYSLNIQIEFRDCVSGEQLKIYQDLIECEVCQKGQYSFNIEQCQDCPIGATCNGGLDVVMNNGYWRKTNKSNLIIQCSNLEENCSGGSHGDNICYEGHVGALCEECDIKGEIWSHSYSKLTKYRCTRCDKIKYNSWVVVIVMVWTQISLSLALKGNVDHLRQKIAIETLRKSIRKKCKESPYLKSSITKSKLISQSRINVSSSSIKANFEQANTDCQKSNQYGIYIKMFTNYMQIVSAIQTFNLQISEGILNASQFAGQPLQQTMNSLDCALENINQDIPIIYLRLILSIIMPFVYLLIFLIGTSIYSLYQKQNKFSVQTIITAIIFLIIYVQPDLVSQTISLLSCRQIGDTRYILSNVSYECYTDEHKQYISFLVIPILLLWVFILPSFLFLLLRRNKNQLDTKQVLLKYGYLYKEYKTNAFYWEFIKMIEKIAIIISLNLYSQSIVVKGLLIFMIISMYGIASIIVEPYKDKDVNKVDSYSTNVCAVTFLLGSFIYNNPYSYFVYCSIVFMIILKIWFITQVLKIIIQGFIQRVKDFILPLLKRLSKKIECFGAIFQYFKREKPLKKMNPIIKQKIRNLFQKYLDMSPSEKRIFILKIFEFQISNSHSHIFKERNGLISQDNTEQQLASNHQAIVTETLNNVQTTQSLNSPLQKRSTLSPFKIDSQSNIKENSQFTQIFLLSPIQSSEKPNFQKIESKVEIITEEPQEME